AAARQGAAVPAPAAPRGRHGPRRREVRPAQRRDVSARVTLGNQVRARTDRRDFGSRPSERQGLFAAGSSTGRQEAREGRILRVRQRIPCFSTGPLGSTKGCVRNVAPGALRQSRTACRRPVDNSPPPQRGRRATAPGNHPLYLSDTPSLPVSLFILLFE